MTERALSAGAGHSLNARAGELGSDVPLCKVSAKSSQRKVAGKVAEFQAETFKRTAAANHCERNPKNLGAVIKCVSH